MKGTKKRREEDGWISPCDVWRCAAPDSSSICGGRGGGGTGGERGDRKEVEGID